ncbi:MAG: metal ABC transporter permease [Bacteriovoracales bacterium]|nr:metal ABC transporter permease [Bacteriovoracales bacterium]
MELWSSFQDFLQYDFLFNALVGTLILALTCGLVSPLIIARKQSFMGVAVSHSAIFGVAVGLVFFSKEQTFPVFLVTLLSTFALVGLLAFADFREKLPSDSLIGVFFTTSMGLGILIYTLVHQNSGDLLSYLFGNILLLTTTDLMIALIVLLMTFPLIIIPFKKWIYFTFDREAAMISGLPTSLYHYTFSFMITLIIVSSMKIAGTVLVNTLLLIPGIVGLKLAKNVWTAFVYSVLFSLLSSVVSLVMANYLNTPSGATLAVGQCLLLMLFLGLKRIL